MAGWGGKAPKQETTNLRTRKLAAPALIRLYRDGGVVCVANLFLFMRYSSNFVLGSHDLTALKC